MNKKQRLAHIRQVVFVLLAFAALVFWLTRDSQNEVELFCLNLEKGDKYDEVIKKVKERDLSLPFYAKEKNRLTVFDKKGRLFKSGCSIEFRQGYMTKTTFFKR